MLKGVALIPTFSKFIPTFSKISVCMQLSPFYIEEVREMYFVST